MLERGECREGCNAAVWNDVTELNEKKQFRFDNWQFLADVMKYKVTHVHVCPVRWQPILN